MPLTGIDMFKDVVENSIDGILVLDEQGVILYCNPAARLLFKDTAENPEGQMFGFPIVEGESTDLEMIDPRGRIKQVEMRVAVTEWKGQNAHIASLRDITDRKAVEDQLRSSRKEWERTFDAIDDVIAIVDLDRKIIRINTAVRKSFQKTPEQVTGKICCTLFDSDSICDGCPLPHTIKNQEVHSAEVIHPHLEKILQVTTFPLFDEAGQLIGAVHISKDVTKVKSLENRLLHAHKMESIGTLAGGIAHDFNNILTAIMGFTELAQGEAEDQEDLQEDLLEIHTAASRAADLVRQILTFSRMRGTEKSELRLKPVIEDALKMIRSVLPASIDIETRLDTGLNPVMADSTQIHQVVMNLCTNASQAMEENGGLLTITLKAVDVTPATSGKCDYLTPGGYIELAVSDTGCGIESKHMDTIFDPYFTTKNVGEGTGLGLSVVHGIVKDSGGEVVVRSEAGQGTCFLVYFPTIGKKKPEKKISEFDVGCEKGYGHILVVDDELPIVKICGRLLKQHGFDVTLKNSSTDALEYIKTHPGTIDLVITDMTMPVLNGNRLAIRIFQLEPDLPVILMSGYSKELCDEKISLPNIKAVLMKPVSKQDLLTHIFPILQAKPRYSP
ncbi:MAG: ATP-binding protein [Desulfobacterales bacterium]|nr:ATP-binding protein [Desulfobacterales bacterium]